MPISNYLLRNLYFRLLNSISERCKYDLKFIPPTGKRKLFIFDTEVATIY